VVEHVFIVVRLVLPSLFPPPPSFHSLPTPHAHPATLSSVSQAQELEAAGRYFNIPSNVSAGVLVWTWIKDVVQAVVAGPSHSAWPQIEATLLPERERGGWALTLPVGLMKSGERSILVLTDNIDPASGAIVEHILHLVLHAEGRIDERRCALDLRKLQPSSDTDTAGGAESDSCSGSDVSDGGEDSENGEDPAAQLRRMLQGLGGGDPAMLRRMFEGLGSGSAGGPTVVHGEYGGFRAGQKVVVNTPTPKYGLGAIKPHTRHECHVDACAAEASAFATARLTQDSLAMASVAAQCRHDPRVRPRRRRDCRLPRKGRVGRAGLRAAAARRRRRGGRAGHRRRLGARGALWCALRSPAGVVCPCCTVKAAGRGAALLSVLKRWARILVSAGVLMAS
jgi:hypothetical protein